MYIGFFNYYEVYNRNRMFTDKSSPIGDDLMYPFVYLGEYLARRGHRVSTIDMDSLERFDAVVFLDFPTLQNGYFRRLVKSESKTLYLLAFESEVIRPDNWNVSNHEYFKKIFTWNDAIVDNKRYFKINFSSGVPADLDFDVGEKYTLCTMIAGNKAADHPLELYTERIRAIRWFEENHPADFDLYGIGWDKHLFKGTLSRLNGFDALRRVLKPRYPSYRGSIVSKRETYRRYRFAICYENARDIPGYITEKIFDCFFAGCVPVYYGAPNVTAHIPADTFVDRRNFKTYEELYCYLANMSEEEYLDYLDAIAAFVKSDAMYPFSVEYFAETIVTEIVRGN
jgi:hypothetical protein